LPANLRQNVETLGAVIDRAILWYTSHRPRSLRTASTHLNLIKADLGHLVAADLTPDDVDQWVSNHIDWSAATKNRYKATFGRVLQLAVVSGSLQRNAARLVTARREDNRRTQKELLLKQVQLQRIVRIRCPIRVPVLFLQSLACPLSTTVDETTY